jgi:hypothetical protein
MSARRSRLKDLMRSRPWVRTLNSAIGIRFRTLVALMPSFFGLAFRARIAGSGNLFISLLLNILVLLDELGITAAMFIGHVDPLARQPASSCLCSHDPIGGTWFRFRTPKGEGNLGISNGLLRLWLAPRC